MPNKFFISKLCDTCAHLHHPCLVREAFSHHPSTIDHHINKLFGMEVRCDIGVRGCERWEEAGWVGEVRNGGGLGARVTTTTSNLSTEDLMTLMKEVSDAISKI